MVEENPSLTKIIKWNKKLSHWRNKQHDLMSKKYNKVDMTLNYIEQSLVLVSAVTGCVSILPLIGIPVGIVSSAKQLKICATTALDKYVWTNKKW